MTSRLHVAGLWLSRGQYQASDGCGHMDFYFKLQLYSWITVGLDYCWILSLEAILDEAILETFWK
jgi:hypothetical protein